MEGTAGVSAAVWSGGFVPCVVAVPGWSSIAREHLSCSVNRDFLLLCCLFSNVRYFNICNNCQVQQETPPIASSAPLPPALYGKETWLFLQDLKLLKKLEGMWNGLTPVFYSRVLQQQPGTWWVLGMAKGRSLFLCFFCQARIRWRRQHPPHLPLGSPSLPGGVPSRQGARGRDAALLVSSVTFSNFLF